MFLAYLYTVSVVFFIYLQFYQYQQYRKRRLQSGHASSQISPGLVLKDARIQYGAEEHEVNINMLCDLLVIHTEFRITTKIYTLYHTLSKYCTHHKACVCLCMTGHFVSF